MGKAEIGSMSDYVRQNPERAGDELAAAERKLAAIREVIARNITPGAALAGTADILHIIDGD